MTRRTLLFFTAALTLQGCDRAEPPTRREPETPKAAVTPHAVSGPRPVASVAAPEPSAHTAVADAGAADAALDADAAADASDGLVRPALFDEQHEVLPQTKDRPSVDSPWFKAGIAALFRAIQSDDPSIAEAFFFPVEAYDLVKDVQKPARDWKFRLMAHFKRDIHHYHRRLGKHADRARLVGIDLNDKTERWMKPGSEGNKLGYFRVTHSRLRYELDGKTRSMEVTSFISWRGEWYLVHLDGFK